MMTVGTEVPIMPTPRPWMTTVAGPVMPRSLIEMTGPGVERRWSSTR